MGIGPAGAFGRVAGIGGLWIGEARHVKTVGPAHHDWTPMCQAQPIRGSTVREHIKHIIPPPEAL